MPTLKFSKLSLRLGPTLRAIAFCVSSISFENLAIAQQKAISLTDFVHSSLSLSADYKDTVAELRISELKSDVAGALTKTSLSLSPYQDHFNISEPAPLTVSGYQETGLRTSLTQALPTGTAITLGIDTIFDHNRADSIAAERTYSLGVTQALWRNAFGRSDRLNSEASQFAVKARKAQVDLQRVRTCADAATAFIDAWISARKADYYRDLDKGSQDLKRAGQSARARGLLSNADWLGLQGDALKLESLKTKADSDAFEAKKKMARFSPLADTASLLDPSTLLNSLDQNLLNLKSPRRSDSEEYYAKLEESLVRQSQSARSASDPDLDLKLEGRTATGDYGSASYKDDRVTIGVSLGWSFQDPGRRAQTIGYEYEAEKARAHLAEASRVKDVSFARAVERLNSLRKQIQSEKDRSSLMEKLTSDARTRFHSGRIDFQEYLTIRDQWLESQMRALELTGEYWREMTTLLFEQRAETRICEAAP